LAKPGVIKGWGLVDGQQFSNANVEVLWGGTGGFKNRTDPGIWLYDSSVKVAFEDLCVRSRLPIRKGWDYRRNNDQTIAFANITSATRSAGQSVFTVDYPTPWVVTSASLTGTLVELVVTMSLETPWPPCSPPALVHVNTLSDATFTTGDYTVTEVFQGANASVVHIRYNQIASGSVAPFAPVGWLASGHCCLTGDVIEVTSTNAEWPQTMYEVVSVTATTITVTDPYGYSPRHASAGPTANIGTYVLQDRQVPRGTSFDQWRNVSAVSIPDTDAELFNCGPTFDDGSCSGFQGYYDTGFLQSAGSVFTIVDPNRGANVLAHPGSRGTCAITTNRINMQDGNIRAGGNADGILYVKAADCIQDSGAGSIRPAIQLFNLSVGTVPTVELHVRNCVNADGPVADPQIDLGGLQGRIFIENSGPIVGVQTTPQNGPWKPVVINEKTGVPWPQVTESFDAQQKTGIWALDSRLAGKRTDVQEQHGISQGQGFFNLVNIDLTTWTNVGTGTVTVTGGKAAPDGTSNAFLISGVGANPQISPASFLASVSPSVVGDHFLYGAWYRGNPSLPDNPLIIGQYVGDDSRTTSILTPFAGNGDWQWIWAVGTVGVGSLTTLDYRIWATTGTDYFMYQPMLIRFPVASFTLNEVYRNAASLKPFGAYLQPGMAGTMTDQKFIAHGGFGTNAAHSRIVGGASGNLALTGTGTVYLPTYDADGTTIIGWVAQLQATIVP
jgi:hypothetical protein